VVREPVYWPRIARAATMARSGASTSTVPSARSMISCFVCLSMPSQRREGLKRSNKKNGPSCEVLRPSIPDRQWAERSGTNTINRRR
jgi:hypothetical protein